MPKKKQISRFMWLLILLSCAIFFLDYDERVQPYNSTILAFSYKYGFISRGLAGTIYQWIDSILPVNMIDYAMVLRFTLIVTLAFYVLFFAFCYQCMKRCQEEYLGRFLYLILFYAVFVVSMFAYKRNFGRLDLYLMALTVIGTMCLIAKKAEWLIVPLSMISVMYHQGYVFMFYNILLALLAYRLLSEKEKKARIYYGVILLVSLIGCSALFLWFEFFSHTDGVRYVDEIIANAKAMTKPFNGMTYHDTLIDHEILGIDLSDVEYPYRVMNWIEIPFFIAIISPYMVLAVKTIPADPGAVSRKNRTAQIWLSCHCRRNAFAPVFDEMRLCALGICPDLLLLYDLSGTGCHGRPDRGGGVDRHFYRDQRKISFCHPFAFAAGAFDTVLGCAYQWAAARNQQPDQ